MQQVAHGGRLYGLDWLRIGAFAMLILYHIGMFFVPWDWHVKTAQPQEWLELPMMAINPWRLALLFLISGVASRTLLAKLGAAGPFARSRSRRLLLPLLAGAAIFVAPQAWAELREKAGYGHGLLYFWLNDYFEFGTSRGLILPTYNHLWFVAYLWLYTMLLSLAALLPASWHTGLQRLFDQLFDGWRLTMLPIAYLAAARIFLFPVFDETHALVDDVYAHLVYGFAFFFGVGAARSRQLWGRLAGKWRWWAVTGVVAYAVIVALDLTIPGDSFELELFVRRLARSVQAWCIILGLIGLALRHLNHDGPARRYLTEAVFPWYIMHQTIIVLVGHGLKPLSLGPALEFTIILAATTAGCAATYELSKRTRWLRPFLGLSPAPQREAAPMPTAAAASALS